ncbi:MAG: ABC transporter substrate-binding protein, partial [Candidatus Rifleibacteriota bacterium]
GLASLLLETSRWGTNYLGMNLKKPPFDSKLVRQTLNFAIDRQVIVQLVLNDRARIANGVLPPGITGFDPKLAGYVYDPAKARELLAQAGFPDGKGFPEIELQYNKDVIHTRIGEFILANFGDIGIKCRIRELDFGPHLQSVESGEAAFFRMGWTVDYPDPDSFLYTLFHSSNIGHGYNFPGLNNPELDKLLDQARFETENEKRVALYRQAERLIVDEAPWVFLYFYTTHLLRQPQVKGITLGPMGQPFINYRLIWLDDNVK